MQPFRMKRLGLEGMADCGDDDECHPLGHLLEGPVHLAKIQ